MNTENSTTNEPHILRLRLADKLNLKGSNKNMVDHILLQTFKIILSTLLKT